jgi:ABC-type molybdate transport system substrate-binding protein
MWNGVADVFGEDLQIIPTPYEYENEIRVHVIGLNYSKYPEKLKKFFDFVRERGPAVFAEHGYVK